MIDTLAWALRTQTGCAYRKSVLIALANFSDMDRYCTPSHAQLAAATELPLELMLTALDELKRLGLISVRRASGASDLLQVHAGQGCTGEMPSQPRRRRSQKAAISEHWAPTPKFVAAAASLGIAGDRLEHEISSFVAYYRTDGRAMSDWDSMWEMWVERAATRLQRRESRSVYAAGLRLVEEAEREAAEAGQ